MSENLLTVLPELQVTSEEIREAEVFAQQYLSALYPTIDFRPGLAIYDQVIRPNATLIALLTKGLTFYFSNNTKEGVTDDSPEDFVDKLMSNHFLSRRIGSTSKVVSRLYFLQQKNVFLSSSYYFSTDNEHFFFPPENLSLSSADMQVSSSADALAPYFLDVELEAETPGEEYNLEEGSLLFFSTFDPFFVGGDILYLKEQTITRETNTEFVDRTESSVSTRNLINDPSIQERMLSTFNYVDNVQPIGHSDIEMIRDIRYVTDSAGNGISEIHMGGMVDVYVDVPSVQFSKVPVKVEYNEATDELGFFLYGAVTDYTPTSPPTEDPDEVINGEGYLNLIEGIPSWSKDTPPMNFVGYDDTGRVDDGDYSLDTGFSINQSAFVRMPETISVTDEDGTIIETVTITVGDYFYVNTDKFIGLDSIQTYLDDVITRVIVAGYLARAMDMYRLKFHVEVFGGVPIPDPAYLRPFIEDYVDSIGPGGIFIMSDLVCVLTQDAGIDNLSVPVTVTYDRFTRNGNVEFGVVIEDIKDIDRLSRFEVGVITSDEIPFEEVGIGEPLLDV